MDGNALANFILDFCESRGINVTNLSLQKIMYFCHVWHLVKNKNPLIRHLFEAWQYGPVLPYVYRQFSIFGDGPIRDRAKITDRFSGDVVVVDYDFDIEMKEFLENIIEFYGKMRAFDLVQLSHEEGGPWDKVWNHEGTVNPGMRIGNDLISEYYSRKLGGDQRQ